MTHWSACDCFVACGGDGFPILVQGGIRNSNASHFEMADVSFPSILVIGAGLLAGFAGSQHSDERRRRRLAVEQDSPRRGAAKVGAAACRLPSGDVETVTMQVAELLPAALGKYLLAATLLAVIGSGLLLGNLVDPQLLGIDVAVSQTLQQRAVRLFGGLSLLGAAQFSLLIRSIRGRSRNDFDGRYRLWNWVTLACGFLGVATLLSLQDVVGECAASLLKQPLLAVGSVTWRISALLLGAPLLLAMRRELRDSRLTFVLLHGVAICYALAIGSVLIPGGFSVAGVDVEQAAAMAGHLFVLLTMSLHARYVVHCNPESAVSVIRPFRIKIPRLRLPRLRLPAIRLRKRDKPERQEVSKQPAKKENRVPAAIEVIPAEPPPPAKKPAKRRKTRIEAAHVEETKQPSPPSKQPSKQPSKPRTAPRRKAVLETEEWPELSASTPEEISEDELKGLTKKQRRQLRKQRRDEQRAVRNS